MTSLASMADRLDNALNALEPLRNFANNDEDAAYHRHMLNKVQTEVVAAKRLVNGLLGGLALASRRDALARQDESVRLTFHRAERVPRSAWPPVDPMDDGVDGEGSDLCRAR